MSQHGEQADRSKRQPRKTLLLRHRLSLSQPSLSGRQAKARGFRILKTIDRGNPVKLGLSAGDLQEAAIKHCGERARECWVGSLQEDVCDGDDELESSDLLHEQ